ncbi:unnamed protein product [Cuscuta europaea]|uniref:Uncharacterized protein n=1 Tax=Cuscuta europaea TaxID=41803 RepID=A0A9P1E3V1_CUSEU|nr:unnamed protein product [Cuscuta europaea]
MDANALFALNKKKGKAQAKKKDPSGQQPVDAFFQKEMTEPSAVAVVADVAGGHEEEEDGKGVEPPVKKQKVVGDVAEKAALMVIIEDRSSAEPPAAIVLTAPSNDPSGEFPRETLQVPLVKGTAVMYGTIEPKAFLGSITSDLDRKALGTYDDEALENKILRSSLIACIALGEQARRLEEWRLQKAHNDEKLKKLIHANSDAIKQMAQLEEDLRQAKAETERDRAVRAEAERIHTEATKKNVEEAERARAEAVSAAERSAVESFVAEGWTAEERKAWLSLMVGRSVDAWVEGPDKDWLAERGDTYYQGSEFFTQHLIYRRLVHHFNVSLDQFDPVVYGLPPLQPDVRIPLPSGEERPVIDDSVMMGRDDDEVTGDDATSKPAEGAIDEAVTS